VQTLNVIINIFLYLRRMAMGLSRLDIIKRVLRISFSKPLLMFSSVFLAAASSLAYFIPYIVIYDLVKALLSGSGSASNAAILRMGLMAFAGSALSVLTYFGALILSHISAFDTSRDFRLSFADAISHLPLGFLISSGTGKAFGIMGSGIEQIQSFIAHKLPDLVISVLYPVVLIVLMLTVNLKYGLSMLAGILIAYFFHYRSMGAGGAKHMMELYYDALEEMENAAVECVRGITLLKTFGRSVCAYMTFNKAVSDYTGMVIPYTRNWEKHMCWFVTLMSNAYLFLIPAALYAIDRGIDPTENASDLVFYLILAPSAASIIPKIGRVMEEIMRVYENIERMDEFLLAPPMRESSAPERLDSHELRFSDVSFSYEENGTSKAISDISFAVPEGTVTAIVGPSGSGKSTISSLIARFWDVDHGTVTVGGKDIRDIPYDQLMSSISFVLQNEYIFTQSVRDNIKAGRQDASDVDVIRAARDANCHSFITSLPDGYETILKESGVFLSSGQLQRVALARAFLKDAPVIVLDEATASQDAENEALIRDALDRLTRNKTVIMIAHRLSSVINADQILVMDHGQIREQGTHEELLKKEGLYADMWKSYGRVLDWHINRKEGGSDDQTT
jgi:ATP-binding cassette subfamily B protein